MPDEDPKDLIARQIDALIIAQIDPAGYVNIIDGGSPFNSCSEVGKIRLHDKAMFLSKALSNALSDYPHKTWEHVVMKLLLTAVS